MQQIIRLPLPLPLPLQERNDACRRPGLPDAALLWWSRQPDFFADYLNWPLPPVGLANRASSFTSQTMISVAKTRYLLLCEADWFR